MHQVKGSVLVTLPMLAFVLTARSPALEVLGLVYMFQHYLLWSCSRAPYARPARVSPCYALLPTTPITEPPTSACYSSPMRAPQYMAPSSSKRAPLCCSMSWVSDVLMSLLLRLLLVAVTGGGVGVVGCCRCCRAACAAAAEAASLCPFAIMMFVAFIARRFSLPCCLCLLQHGLAELPPRYSGKLHAVQQLILAHPFRRS